MLIPGHAFAWNMALRRVRQKAMQGTMCYVLGNLFPCTDCLRYGRVAMRRYIANQLPRMNTAEAIRNKP